MHINERIIKTLNLSRILFTENLRIIQDDNVNYLSRINSILPSFDDAKLKEIYNILLALKK